MEAVMVVGGAAWLRQSPWAVASAAYAWCAAIALTVLIVPGTLLIVVLPALVTLLPLVVAHQYRPVASLLAAVVLAVWGFVGITLLGSYFLPSAALLAVAYGSSRREGVEAKGRYDSRSGS